MGCESDERRLAVVKDKIGLHFGRRTASPPRKPCSEEEKKLLGTNEGRCLICSAPVIEDVSTVNSVPKTADDASKSKYLWVIAADNAPYAVEQILPDRVIKHSNLTGGDVAYCGGEVWFMSKDQICINIGSGRYSDESDSGLGVDVENFFIELEFEVAMPPYNEDLGRIPRIFKSDNDVVWKKPKEKSS